MIARSDPNPFTMPQTHSLYKLTEEPSCITHRLYYVSSLEDRATDLKHQVYMPGNMLRNDYTKVCNLTLPPDFPGIVGLACMNYMAKLY